MSIEPRPTKSKEMGLIYANKGVTLWSIIIAVFVVVLYYLYSGQNSGTVIAQFASVIAILQEFSIHWKPRLNTIVPFWVFLVPSSTYATYLSFGALDAALYCVSLLGLVVVTYVISKKRGRVVATDS